MKNIFILLLLLFLPMKLFGTKQAPDRMIYKGDTTFLFTYPLEWYPNCELINKKNLFKSNIDGFSTDCWRGYIATWEITDNELYLTKIENDTYRSYINDPVAYNNVGIEIDSVGSEFADLESLFPDSYINGKVRADWVNGKLFVSQGKLLLEINVDFPSIYEREIEFTVVNGFIIGSALLDNSKSKRSKYTEDLKLLSDFISSNINYDNLPKSDTIKGRVVVSIFSSDDNGKIDSVTVTRGINEIYDREAVRVVKSIPEWDVLYWHGEKFNCIWNIPVTFNKTGKNE